MCRFVFYMGAPLTLADLVTRPEHSLINQSVRARERPEPLNGDGFGLAWYVEDDPVPARFRSLTPAWSNSNLEELARVTRSHCILAHVRAATAGLEVSESNCHPFRRGRLAFMHNGHIPGFPQLRRALMDRLSDDGFNGIRGTTDTEHVFALVADYLEEHVESRSADALAAALAKAIDELRRLIDAHAPGTHCYLNVVLADGQHAVACRYSSDPNYIDSLYLATGSAYRCELGRCWMEPDSGGSRAILIGSEPLSQGSDWRPIPRNHLALIDRQLGVDLRPLQ